MNLPDYPTDIDTPEALLITSRMMQQHAQSIGAFDWVLALKQIQSALFWACEIKKQMEEEHGQISSDRREDEPTKQ